MICDTIVIVFSLRKSSEGRVWSVGRYWTINGAFTGQREVVSISGLLNGESSSSSLIVRMRERYERVGDK